MLISRSAEDPMFHLRLSLQNQKARKWVGISLFNLRWRKTLLNFENNFSTNLKEILTTRQNLKFWFEIQVERKAEAEEERGDYAAEEKYNSLLRILSDK